MSSVRRMFSLDPRYAYLNHGSFGAVPRIVQDAQVAVRSDIEMNPHRFYSEKYPKLLHDSRRRVAEWVHHEPEGLVFVKSVTEGVNAVIRSLSLSAGDEVVTTTHEYDSLLEMWRLRCRSTGAKLVSADLPYTSMDNWICHLLGYISDRTRVLYLSHITSSTALRVDIGELVSAAKAKGAVVIIDGAHGPGQIGLDLSEIGCDVYIGSLHKWAMFPRGASFIAAAPGVREAIKPSLVSWYYDQVNLVDRFEWQGTSDPSAWLVADTAIDFVHRSQVMGAYNHAARLSAYAELSLLEIDGVIPVTPPSMRSPYFFTVTLDVPEKLLRSALRGAEIWAWTGLWSGKTLIRVSTYLYNDEREVERLVDVVRTTIREAVSSA